MRLKACSSPGIRVSGFRAILGATVAFLILIHMGWAQNSGIPNKKVLILYSFDNEEGIYTGLDHVLRSQLRMRSRERVEFYTEYLDLIRFPSPDHAQSVARLLKLKYSQQTPDLIIPISYAALQFLVDEGKDLFPSAPIVALFNRRRMQDFQQHIADPSKRSITGVASSDDPARTLDLALQLQPDTEHVAVVIGSSLLERYWLSELKNDLSPYAGKVEIIYLADLSMSELLEKVTVLPPHTIILSTFFFQDATSQFFLPEEVLDLVSRQAHVPIYGIYSNYIGHGVVGGRMTDSEVTGRKLANVATAVLNGEDANRIPIATDDSARDTVDWRQLRRWDIDEKRLPPETLALFHEPSAWQRSRTLALFLLLFGLLESILFFAIVASVRRRRHAETALQREKALADAVIEGLPGLFVLQDMTGKNIRWNKNAERVSRYSLGDVATFGNIVESDKEAIRAMQQRILDEGSGQVEARIYIDNGQIAPFYITGVKVVMEGRPYVAAVAIDLTERKQVEEALRRSEGAIRSLVQHAPFGIGTISLERNQFLQANPALVKLLGYKSESEVIALSVSRDLFFNAYKFDFNLPSHSGALKATEFTWKRKDGRPVNVRATTRRIPDSPERDSLIEVTAEDVTARRLLEEQLRHSQKMEALGQLSGSVAHDFNNLLSVIIGYSELLSLNPAADGPMKTHLETIKKAGERAASLTAQLLAFSRRQVMQPSVLNLNTLVRETEKMLRRLMRENVEAKMVLDAGLWKTKADPGQMVQVIMNLAINARDAMPKGGRLRIETSNVTFGSFDSMHKVDINAGNYVKLAVTDTGTGMSAETQARIFEPFFTTKEAGKGTGLGLATVYGIVKQSGGYIFVDSQLGRGTTFTVYLPQFDQPTYTPTKSSEGLEPPTTRQGSETLLVVEDEGSFRDLLRDGLQANGYQILVAANGVDALRVAEQHEGPIRLLVTDVIMPLMSGPELASAMRKIRPQTDVLYMSGYTDDKLRDESTSGELTLIQKPFYIDELLVKIREIIARKKPLTV